MKNIKKRTYEILNVSPTNDKVGRGVDLFMIILIILNIFTFPHPAVNHFQPNQSRKNVKIQVAQMLFLRKFINIYHSSFLLNYIQH